MYSGKIQFIRKSLTTVLCFVLVLSSAQYVDETIDAGILHAHAQPSLMGGGAAFFDYNLDGWIDIYMTGGENSDKLYENQGGNRFIDRSELLPHNPGKTGTTSSVTTGDINNDGCVDVILTTFNRDDPTIILKNNCDGTFTEMTATSGSLTGPGIGATLFDYNNDGMLDLYVINYIDSLIFIKDEDDNIIGFDHKCYPHYLYRNNGDFQFENVTEQYQVGGNGCTLAVAVLPLKDGQWGIYLANDFGEFIMPNQLFVYNEESDSFDEKSQEYGLDVAVYGMGIAIGDYDNDMDFDIYVTNMGQNAFMVNEGGVYVDKAVEYGIDNTYVNPPEFSTGWGTFFFDYDNDKDLDLFVANGFVPAADFLSPSIVDPCKLFSNTTNGFFDATEQANVGVTTINRGSIYGDTDNDGDLDIVITNTIFGGEYDDVASYRFLKNEGATLNFIKIELEGVESNRDAFGAQLVLYIDDETYLQYLFSSGTHASQSSSIVHFGLGDAQGADSLKVMWPSGLTTMHYDIPGNQMVHIVEGTADFGVVGCLNPEDPYYNPLATIDGGCSTGTSGSRDLAYDDSAVAIYPTLSDGHFFINPKSDLGECRLEVVDGSGRLIDSKKLYLLSGNIQEIEISNAYPGIYFLHLISSDLHYTSKVIITD